MAVGNALRWIYCGNADASVDSDGAVNFCGGTERFEAATGGFEVEVQERTPDSDDPLLTHRDYTGNGIVRY